MPERAATTAPLRLGSTARARTAKILTDALYRRYERGDDSCTTRAIAARCKVNPRVVHEYRHGERSAPWALAWVLPLEVVEEINESIVSERSGGRTWRWALALVRRGLDWIEDHGARPVDRYEARHALLDAQERITRALRRLEEDAP